MDKGQAPKFRQWLRKQGQRTQFRKDYLRDRRAPNHTTWEEIVAYLKGCPYAGHTTQARAAFRSYSALPEVRAETVGHWTRRRK
jgi:hypothetical protein